MTKTDSKYFKKDVEVKEDTKMIKKSVSKSQKYYVPKVATNAQESQLQW